MFGKVARALRTFAAIEGLPVLSLATGEECGHVVDLLYDNGAVAGLVIDVKGWFKRHMMLPLEVVDSFGEDGVMVADSDVLRPFHKSKAAVLKSGRNRLQGTPLLTREGEKLGLVEDVYFHEEMGTIIGYEVTEGLVADILEGRKVVKSEAKLTIGGGRAILTE